MAKKSYGRTTSGVPIADEPVGRLAAKAAYQAGWSAWRFEMPGRTGSA